RGPSRSRGLPLRVARRGRSDPAEHRPAPESTRPDANSCPPEQSETEVASVAQASTCRRLQVPWRRETPQQMNIAQHLERAARHFPERAAIVFEDQEFSYAALQERVDRTAHALLALGVAKGDRVGLFLPNIPEFAVV